MSEHQIVAEGPEAWEDFADWIRSMTMLSACQRKLRYRSELDAKIALASTHRARSTRREETRAYQCPTCHGWHLTSQRTRR